MQRYIGDILDGCGRDTRNDDFTAISKEDALRYARYAQGRLQSVITKKYPHTFIATYTQNIAADTSLYSVADNMHLGSRIVRVRYNPTADSVSWRVLRYGNYYRKYSPSPGTPSCWTRENGQVRIEPPPNATIGQLEIAYERTLDVLDLRRGQISATPSGAILDLTTGSGPTTADEALFVAKQFVSVCDYYGTVMLRNGVISSYNAANDELTLAANVSTYLVTGYTLADLANGYLTVGKWTSTHSALHDDCERYITEYVNRRLYKRDSRNDTGLIENELQDIEKDIVDSYKNADHTIKPIPLVDEDILVYPIWES